MTLHLPPVIPDPAWQRRREALARASCATERDEVLAEPLVADRTFTPGAPVDCPRGHVDDHAADWPPVNHAGRPAIARTCHRCGSTWLELIAS
jgi:hypothetical protein